MLTPDRVVYFGDVNECRAGSPPKGIIHLNGFTVTPWSEEGGELDFLIAAYPKSMVCRASSGRELQSWVNALQSPLNLAADAPLLRYLYDGNQEKLHDIPAKASDFTAISFH